MGLLVYPSIRFGPLLSRSNSGRVSVAFGGRILDSIEDPQSSERDGASFLERPEAPLFTPRDGEPALRFPLPDDGPLKEQVKVRSVRFLIELPSRVSQLLLLPAPAVRRSGVCSCCCPRRRPRWIFPSTWKLDVVYPSSRRPFSWAFPVLLKLATCCRSGLFGSPTFSAMPPNPKAFNFLRSP